MHDRQLTQRLRQREVEWMHARNKSAVARSGHSWLVRFEGTRQVDYDPDCYLPPDVYVSVEERAAREALFAGR